MSQTTSSKSDNANGWEELDAWIYGEPSIDDNCRQLLSAYRAAIQAANEQELQNAALDETGEESTGEAPYRRRISSVPRLTHVDGVESDQLSRSHGRLVAIGLLREDLAGAAGLTYRITGDAVRRLAGEEASEAA